MLPLIIVCRDEKKISRYLEGFIADNNFSANYIYKIHPLKNEVSISQVRELKKDLILSQKNKRLIIFYDFHASSLEAQNGLLKILEEEIEKNQFVLITKNSERVLATIKSRAKIINLDKHEKIKPVEKQWIDLFKQIKKSSDLGFLNYPKIINLTKEDVISFFYQATLFFRDELHKQSNQSAKIIQILKKIFQLSNLLENNNLNPQLALDNLLIFIWKKYRNILGE